MSFKPNYTITDKILNNLTLVASAREFIEQGNLIPKWESRLRREALEHNAHSSTAIEGNKLTLRQVEALMENQKISSADKDIREVLNYINALKRIPTFIEKDQKIRVEDLLNIHAIITKNALQNSADSGAFRTKQVYVGRKSFDSTSYREEVEYMPPKTEKVPGLVKEFIDWLSSNAAWETNPILLAGIVHYEIARIHPFIDGNGRAARFLATLILYLIGFDRRRIFAFDDYYDKDRSAYYAALKTAQASNGDITQWLEYFTTGAAYSVTEVKETVLKLSRQRRKRGGADIPLAVKQQAIIVYINTHGKVTNRDLQDLFRNSSQAVHKELAKLVELEMIKPIGGGRSIYYVLA